jgi:hypothetical protein
MKVQNETMKRACQSAECIAESHSILSKIDQNINPCNDFYEYSCGRWRDEHAIPQDKSGYGQFDVARDRINVSSSPSKVDFMFMGVVEDATSVGTSFKSTRKVEQ